MSAEAQAPVDRQAGLYGLLAEFMAPETLVAAARAARAAGYRRMEAYSPYPVAGLAEALHYRRTFIPSIALVAGLLGCSGGFYMQYYMNAVDYALNVGGRPLNSWPAWIPITFELTVLSAVLATVIGMFALNGLPRLHHPLFSDAGFELSTRDRFFLCIEAADPKFDRQATKGFLQALQACEVRDVEDLEQRAARHL